MHARSSPASNNAGHDNNETYMEDVNFTRHSASCLLLTALKVAQQRLQPLRHVTQPISGLGGLLTQGVHLLGPRFHDRSQTVALHHRLSTLLTLLFKTRNTLLPPGSIRAQTAQFSVRLRELLLRRACQASQVHFLRRPARSLCHATHFLVCFDSRGAIVLVLLRLQLFLQLLCSSEGGLTLGGQGRQSLLPLRGGRLQRRLQLLYLTLGRRKETFQL